MKKLIALILTAIMLTASLTSCGKPPEFSEIEGRLRELIEASYEINEIFFGNGLPTYERVSDPKNSMQILRSEDDSRVTYYYELTDEALGRVVAYRVATLAYSYAQILTEPDAAREAIWTDAEQGLYVYAVDYTPSENASKPGKIENRKDEQAGTITYYYYELTDETLGRLVAYRTSDIRYTYVQVLTASDPTREAVFEDAEKGAYAYEIAYTEPTYDFYYTSSDPHDYDYVRDDAKFHSIAEIKEEAEKVYSKEYLAAIYLGLFEGTGLGDNESLDHLTARYYEYTNDYGEVSLMKSNTYQPLVSEKRIFDLSTAKIVRPKRKNFVTIEVESYLESTPDRRETVKLTMILQDGVWMLDSGTY